MKTLLATFFALIAASTFSAEHNHHHDHANCNGEHNHDHSQHEEKHHHDDHNGCNGEHNHNHNEHADSHNDHSGALTVEINEASAKNAGIETVHPRKRASGSEYAFKGRFELVPEAREIIASPVPGKMELKVKSLKHVKKGDTLFTVTSPEIVSRTKEIEILEKRLQVFRDIKTPNAELENNLSLKKSELNALLMGYTANNGTIEVKAPKSGLVEELLELNGTWLETGSAILKLTDTRNIRFKGLIPADEAARLKDLMPANVKGMNGSIRLGIGGENGLVPAYIVFENAPDAIIGARDTATVIMGGNGKVETAVPDSAIVEINLVKHVFVRDNHNKNRFIAISVTTGEKSGGWTSVTGIPEGHIEVVSKGAYQLKLASSSSGKSAAGHFHADGTFHEGDH